MDDDKKPDELDFVDEDIRAYFKSQDPHFSYFQGTPTLMQVARNLRQVEAKLDAIIEALKTKPT